MLAPGASFAVDTLVALGLLSVWDTSFALQALVEREILVNQKAIVGKREALPRVKSWLVKSRGAKGWWMECGKLVKEKMVDGRWWWEDSGCKKVEGEVVERKMVEGTIVEGGWC